MYIDDEQDGKDMNSMNQESQIREDAPYDMNLRIRPEYYIGLVDIRPHFHRLDMSLLLNLGNTCLFVEQSALLVLLGLSTPHNQAMGIRNMNLKCHIDLVDTRHVYHHSNMFVSPSLDNTYAMTLMTLMMLAWVHLAWV